MNQMLNVFLVFVFNFLIFIVLYWQHNYKQYLLNYDRVQGNRCLCWSFYRFFPPYDMPINYCIAVFSSVSLADYMEDQIYAKYCQFLIHCHFLAQGFVKLILVYLCTFYWKCMSYLVLAYALTHPITVHIDLFFYGLPPVLACIGATKMVFISLKTHGFILLSWILQAV
jgi:hypothetical protein